MTKTSPDESLLSLSEISEVCHVDETWIVELVEYGVLAPAGRSKQEWFFSEQDTIRSQKAHRLHEDLEVNLAGLALVLDLLDELDEVRSQLRFWEELHGKHK